MIDDWFKHVNTYDLSLESTSNRKLEDGKYEITLHILSKRYETQSDGGNKAIAINEPILIGLFSLHSSAVKKEGGILYLKLHQINKEQMNITVIADELPQYVGIDPYGTRCDEDFVDNLISVEK